MSRSSRAHKAVNYYEEPVGNSDDSDFELSDAEVAPKRKRTQQTKAKSNPDKTAGSKKAPAAATPTKRVKHDTKEKRSDGVLSPSAGAAECSSSGSSNNGDDQLEREGTLVIESTPAEQQECPEVLAEDSIYAIPESTPTHSTVENGNSYINLGSQGSSELSSLASGDEDSASNESAYEDDGDDDDGGWSGDQKPAKPKSGDKNVIVDIVVSKKKGAAKRTPGRAAGKAKGQQAAATTTAKARRGRAANSSTSASAGTSTAKRQTQPLKKTSLESQPIKRAAVHTTPTKRNAALGSLLSSSPKSPRASRPTLSKASSSSSSLLSSPALSLSPTQESGLRRKLGVGARGGKAGTSLKDLLSGSSVPRAGLSRRTPVKKLLHS
ncbi:hypothetical protein GQ54DRAFT_294831 [Martensiomyces pterosporus]|nr:hypothetical protein GQ54DRAFT_294831 [Martensiomyces pterosporus]